MTENTQVTDTAPAATATAAPEGSVNPTTETSTPESGTEAPRMDSEAVQAQLDALHGKEPEKASEDAKDAPEGDPKEEPKAEPKEDDKSKDESKDSEPDLATFGYEGLNEEQTAIANVAMAANINFEQINNAIVDGELDVTKLEGVDPTTALILKSGVDGQITKLKARNEGIRTEIHETVGGEDTFNSMVDWAKKQMGTDTAFNTDAKELFSMMNKGGLAGKMAAKELFSQFESDPSTSLKPKASTPSAPAPEKEMSRSEKLEAGWEEYKRKAALLK